MIPTTDRPGVHLHQFAFMVKDIDAWVEKYRRLLGGETAGVTTNPVTCNKVAHFYFPDTGADLQLMEPAEGSMWHDFLKERGDGLHHLSLRVDDYDEVYNGFLERGVRVVHEGTFTNDARIRYAYFDTLELGYLTEINGILEVRKLDGK